MDKERQGKGEHEIFAGGKAEQVADDFRERSHGGHALVIKQSGFTFLGGTSGHSSGSKKHKDKSLYAKQPGKSFSGSVYGRGFPSFPVFRFFIINPLAVGTFEISSEISEARQDEREQSPCDELFQAQPFPNALADEGIESGETS